MKALRVGLVVLALAILGLLGYVLTHALYTQRPVGFQVVSVPDEGGKGIGTAVWYATTASAWPTTLLGVNLLSVAQDGPVDGTKLPLVVISHGNQAGPGSHVDLAMALAERGFVVAALTHPGDNIADSSAIGSARWLPDRNRHLRSTVNFMLDSWASRDRIDAQRVGVFGFSAGAFTALTVAGGRPDLSRIASHCATKDEFICKVLVATRSEMVDPAKLPQPEAFVRDARVKAAVVAAPGLGFTFVPNGLADVNVPLQVWSGSADENVPTVTNAKPIVQVLGSRATLTEVAGASHFSFVAPCRLFGPPLLCRDANGLDRAAMHRQMNDAIAEFFTRSM